MQIKQLTLTFTLAIYLLLISVITNGELLACPDGSLVANNDLCPLSRITMNNGKCLGIELDGILKPQSWDCEEFSYNPNTLQIIIGSAEDSTKCLGFNIVTDSVLSMDCSANLNEKWIVRGNLGHIRSLVVVDSCLETNFGRIYLNNCREVEQQQFIWSPLSPTQSTPATPNILMIVLDDFGWSDISFGDHHNAEYSTEHIDSLFETGIELINYYVHPTCTPTRSALMTGQYSFKNGLQPIDTMPPGSSAHIPFDNPTIMELLKPLGYRNEMIGKWHLGYAAWNMTPTGRGFDNHYGFFQDAQDYYTHITISPKPITNPFEEEGFDFWDNKEVAWEANGIYSTDLYYDRFTRVIAEYALEKDNNNNNMPLFMYLPFQTVHTPIEYPSVNLTEKCAHILNQQRRTYCLKVVYLDSKIGEIIGLYKYYDLWKDTLLILTTDNGGMVNWTNISSIAGGVATSYGCNMPYRAGKATLYEGGVKSIATINGGDNIIPINARGTAFSGVMHAIDWMPTIYEGLLSAHFTPSIGEKLDGLDMWDDMLGINLESSNNINVPWYEQRTVFLDIEKEGEFAAVRQGDYKFFKGPLNHPDVCEFDICLLYHGYYPCDQSPAYGKGANDTTEFLYDIVNDPYETTNLAEAEPDIVDYFIEKIREFVLFGGYKLAQSDIIHLEALPIFHNHTWAPWL